MIAKLDLSSLNNKFRNSDADDIIQFAINLAERPLVTTSFGAHSAAILYGTTRLNKNIQVVWCDTLFNTEATYKHAEVLISMLQLNIEIFRPMGEVLGANLLSEKKEIQDFDANEFARKIKLEPFNRAIHKYKPDVWFTTIRKNQSSYRNTLNVFSLTSDGILRVSPFYHYTDDEIRYYLTKNELPMEYDYFDPVKSSSKSECGIQIRS